MHFDEFGSIDPVAAIAVGVCIIVLLGVAIYLLVQAQRARRQKRRTDAVTRAVLSYFRHNGVGVAAGSVSLTPNRYTVFIESQPMKRFRLSHIIEATVRDHVKKTCGLDVEKIYWRFPINQNAPGAERGRNPDQSEDQDQPVEDKDDYINEGLRHLPKMEAQETAWETFEEISQKMEAVTAPNTQA